MKRSGRNKKSPAFQFYPTDFLSEGKSAGLNMIERGVFVTLLSHQWLEGGPLEDDHEWFARLCHIPLEEFEGHWRMVKRCFKHEAGRVFSGRLERERAAQVENAAARRAWMEQLNAQKQAESGAVTDTVTDTVTAHPLTPVPTPEPLFPVPTPGERESGADAPAPKQPKRQRAESWESILARPEYAELRNDPKFGDSWSEWIAWCHTSGVKAKVPRGAQASKLLNLAVEWGSTAFAASVSYSIAGDYPSLYDQRGKASGNGSAPVRRDGLMTASQALQLAFQRQNGAT